MSVVQEQDLLWNLLIMDYLQKKLKGGGNIIISGELASGKTYLLQKLWSSIPKDNRVALIDRYGRVLSPSDAIGKRYESFHRLRNTRMINFPDWVLCDEIDLEDALFFLNLMTIKTNTICTIQGINVKYAVQRFIRKCVGVNMACNYLNKVEDTLYENEPVIVQLALRDSERYIQEIAELKKNKEIVTIYKK